MASTIDITRLVYDSHVARMFGYRTPYSYKETKFGVAEYLESYDDLSVRYREYIADGLLAGAVSTFEKELSFAKELPATKKIDFLIWSAGKLERDGALVYA